MKKVQLSLLYRYLDFLKWKHPHSPQPRSLFIVFGGLGDLLLCETFFHHLKCEQPDRRVEVLIGGALPLFAQMPSVDTIILAPPEKTIGWGWLKKNFRHLAQFLVGRGYEEAVELLAMVPLRGLNSAYTGLLLLATGAPIRIGRTGAGGILLDGDGQELGKIPSFLSHSQRIITHFFDPSDPSLRTKHESLMCREALGKDYQPLSDHPRLARVEGLAELWAKELVNNFSQGGKYLVVGVNLEVAFALKGWPEEGFLRVMEQGRREGARFIIVGLQRSGLASQLKERLKEALLDLSGMTGLEELMALVSQCDLFFSGDTGPAHLAQAFEVPTLVLFGPTNDKEFGPRAGIHKAIVAKRDCGGPPCMMGPCLVGRSCMLNIAEEEVTETLLDMVKKKQAGDYPIQKLPANTDKEVILFQ
jgi:ADP-heptose:LPS heptosyltransferase